MASSERAEILPGLSGSYLLLLMGQYGPILGAIDVFKEELKAGDFAGAMVPAMSVMLPVGIGVVVGVVVVGNLLKWLMRDYRKATLGVLLGLLVGSVVGLYPFQRGVEPAIGSMVKGEVVTEDSLPEIDEEDYPTEYYKPSGGQIAAALALIAVGFGTTVMIAKVGGGEEDAI